MPFVPVLNTALVEVRVLANGQKCENTLWFERATAYDEAVLTGLAEAVADWWVTECAPTISSGVQLVEVVATDQTTATGLQVSFAPVSPTFGGSTANIMPNNVTMAVSFRTALRGRSFRGRNYVVGFTEDQVAGNSFVATLDATWQANYAALIAVADGAGTAWVVASRFSGVDPVTGAPIPRAAGVTTPITNVVVVDSFVDSARRRLTGRGQ